MINYINPISTDYKLHRQKKHFIIKQNTVKEKSRKTYCIIE